MTPNLFDGVHRKNLIINGNPKRYTFSVLSAINNRVGAAKYEAGVPIEDGVIFEVEGFSLPTQYFSLESGAMDYIEGQFK